MDSIDRRHVYDFFIFPLDTLYGLCFPIESCRTTLRTGDTPGYKLDERRFVEEVGPRDHFDDIPERDANIRGRKSVHCDGACAVH